MSFKITLLLIIAAIGAIVGFVRSDGDPMADRIMSAIGSAFIGLLIFGVLLAVLDAGANPDEGSDISNFRTGPN